MCSRQERREQWWVCVSMQWGSRCWMCSTHTGRHRYSWRGERVREDANGGLSMLKLVRDGFLCYSSDRSQDTVGTGDLADVPRGKWPCKVWGSLGQAAPPASRKQDCSSVRSILLKQQKGVGFVLDQSRGRKKFKNLEIFVTSPLFLQGMWFPSQWGACGGGARERGTLGRTSLSCSASHPRWGLPMGRAWLEKARSGPREPTWAMLLWAEGSHLAWTEGESLWLLCHMWGSRLPCRSLALQSCLGGFCSAWRERAIICPASEFLGLCIAPRLPLKKLQCRNCKAEEILCN